MLEYVYCAVVKPAFDLPHQIQEFPIMADALWWAYNSWPEAMSVHITAEPVVNKKQE